MTRPRRRLRWLSRWPATAQEWEAGAAELQSAVQAAAIEEAERTGNDALAEEMRRYASSDFPAAEYLSELNRRSPGAGTRAHRSATKRHRVKRKGQH